LNKGEVAVFQIPILLKALFVSGYHVTDIMKDNQGNEFLNILIGEKLSSVTFVMDYVQLDFDGNRFTFNVWPAITLKGKEYKFGEPSYRDSLCSLIGQVVKKPVGEENQHITITFENGDKLTISLDPQNPELVTPEIGDFIDTNENWYVFN
jgi:hypothetical protein